MMKLNRFVWLLWFLAVISITSGTYFLLDKKGVDERYKMEIFTAVALGSSFVLGLIAISVTRKNSKDGFTFEVSPDKLCCGSCAFNRGKEQCNAACSCCPTGYNGAPKLQFEYLNLSNENWENSQTC